jgi:hypothetical protein
MFSPTISLSMGKYHPSNYKNKNSSTPNELTPLASPALNSLANDRPQHGRQKSDVRQKLLQYQRDMVEQAAHAGRMHLPVGKPVSPRLAPLGSPGPVTPMELEESAGYLMAGMMVDPTNQQDMVGRLIAAEGERARMGESKSPITTSGGRQ